jgi:hypothetical protein
MRQILKIFIATVCASTAMFAAAIAGASAITLPKVTGPIPVTADSFPLMAANRTLQPIDLKKLGYVEEEFIVSGTANVYDWAADGSLTVKIPNVPYATRILVRHPADPARFSGHAVVELTNTARRFDWAMISGYVRDSLYEHGDAWVAVTMPGSVKALPKFNPTRYPGVAFANPNPSETCPAVSDQEDGLRWDMFSQVAAALKSDTLLKARYVYMTSQGGDVVTYLQAFQSHTTLDNGKPAYDGYLIKGPATVGRLRRCGAPLAKDNPRQKIGNDGVPVIQIVAQGEVAEDYRRPDSDEPNDRYRLYEVASAAHIDKYAYGELPSMADQLTALGTPGQGTPDWPFAARCEPEIALQDNPLLKYIFDGAMVNLEQWTSKGIAPPKADRISLKGITDQFGVASGGVRSPYADVPAAVYYTTTPGPGTCRELGRTVPLYWARLEAIYGNHKNYAAKVAQLTDRLVKEHWITESDAQKIKAGQ